MPKNMFSAFISMKSVLPAVGLAMLLVPVVSHAYSIITKPNTPHQSAEFGTRVAAHGVYSLVGAQQDLGSGTGKGAVYLHKSGRSEPESVYQIPGGSGIYWGAQVAISDRWLAFAATNSGQNHSTKPSEIYIAGKKNGVWASCPTVNGTVDCVNSIQENGNNFGKPLTKIDLDPYTKMGMNSTDISLAISDKYLAVANSKKGIVSIYRYDASSGSWIREKYLDSRDDYLAGAALAIDGDRIAIAYPGLSHGIVAVLERNASTGDWEPLDYLTRGSGAGTFATHLDMDSGRLAVGGTTHVEFFKLDQNGLNFSPTGIISVESPVTSIAVDLTKAAASLQSAGATGVIVERFSTTSTGSWSRIAGITQSSVGPDYLNLDFYPTHIDLDSNVLSMGWRGRTYETATGKIDNIGALVRRLFIYSETCVKAGNIVPNCSFADSNATNWQLLNHEGGSSWVSYSNNQMKANISYGGYDFWHVQARTGININYAGDYTLRFKAKADAPRTIVVNVGHNGSNDGNWTSYSRHTIQLTTQMRWFTLPIEAIPVDSNAVLDFNYGNSDISVTLDDVSLMLNY